MDKIFTTHKRQAPKWVIDRFEEEWAVLENSDTHEVISLPAASLPKDAKSGSTLVKQGTKWYVNEADTAAREKMINEKFSRIRSRSE
jgi:hypothetical protein